MPPKRITINKKCPYEGGARRKQWYKQEIEKKKQKIKAEQWREHVRRATCGVIREEAQSRESSGAQTEEQERSSAREQELSSAREPKLSIFQRIKKYFGYNEYVPINQSD